MAERLYLHIGVPKTGTTYLQGILRANGDRLRGLGYAPVAASQPDLVRAMADLCGRRSGPRIDGAWDRLSARVAAASGAVVLSQEELCLASTEQAARALNSLGTDEVTVIVTGRDLARQVASHWQQQLKAKFPGTLAEMVDLIVRRVPTEDDFWGHQGLVEIVDTWLAHLPPERVVIVTVPPAGQPPELLWQRFASACELDPNGFDLTVEHPNESLGAAQAELLRRVNVELGDRLPIGAGYYAVVRMYLANDFLARQARHDPYGLDPVGHAWATTTATDWVADLRTRGVRVVGDLDELVPPPWQRTVDPSAVDEGSLGQSAVAALADVLTEWGSKIKPGPAGLVGGGARKRERPTMPS